jgi:hypothetical protein
VKRNFLVLFLLVTAVIGGGFFFGLRYSAASGIAGRKKEIRANLGRIVAALKTYSQTAGGNGLLPDDPLAVYPKFIDDPEVFVNPSWPDEIGYSYVTGVRTGAETDAPDTILIYENVPPEKRKLGRLVARADGSIEQLSETQFEERLNALKSRFAEQKRTWNVLPVDPGKILK